MDPAFAPGTGTPEVAGLSGREIVEMVRWLHGLSPVAFDLVEVAPPYDSSEITAVSQRTWGPLNEFADAEQATSATGPADDRQW